MKQVGIAKGHGTMNDFILIEDRNNLIQLSPEEVRLLCDRHVGIGGDGLLRAVRAEHLAEWRGEPDLWFMDYRNADGSLAEMCGNGLRVFARFLAEEGLVAEDELRIATRAGVRTAEALPNGLIRAGMGPVELGVTSTVALAGQQWQARQVNVGNPHAVVMLDTDPAQLDLSAPPEYDHRVYPAGVNVEFVQVIEPGHLRMRVYERGSGETLSCGTGVVASAACWAEREGLDATRVLVEVPGGRLQVDLADGQAWLTGPAVIIARGQANLPD